MFIEETKTGLIKSRCENPEEGALEQARIVTKLPFIHKHISLMPDMHLGYGFPIGAVVATDGVIIPNGVGVDIGCGMCAVRTSLKEETIDKDILKSIMGKIREEIPVGFNKHKEKQDAELMPKMFDHEAEKYPIAYNLFESAQLSLGTLGGGNHFIEIQKGDDGFIWIMIHSGSRNLGKQVADYYNKLATELNDKWYSDTQKDLAFLPVDTKEAKDYIEEMQYCVDYALANRELMMERVKSIIGGMYTVTNGVTGEDTVCVQFDDMINIAHNYARLEKHFGKNVRVHRKGATSAKEGEIGIIPGSQGTCSYIVRGKGELQSFKSCSHGAGRKMGRKEAQRTLSLEDEKKILDDLGVIHTIRHESDLDEAPSAYKDISVVMEEQKDLVDIVIKLTPLAVIKG